MSKPLGRQPRVTPESLLALRAQLRRSTAEHYNNPIAAAAAKKIIDTLHESGTPIRVRSTGLSIATMRIQFYQGVKYLTANLDPEKKYAMLSKLTKCSAREDFLEFTIRETAILDRLEMVVPWREELTEYLNNAGPGDKFPRTNISLDTADVIWIGNQLAGLTKANGEPLFIAQVEPGMPLILIRDENN